MFNGVTMLRLLGTAAAAALISMNGARPVVIADTAPPIDVAALLAAANGSPPMICALAAQAVRGYGWGGWSDAPATPLAQFTSVRAHDYSDTQLSAADVDRLVTALGSGDACVRELSVRMLGGQKNETVNAAFSTRLTAPEVPMREVAAYGLGLVAPASAIDPLIVSLRDAAPGVRGNAAWALGRIDNGRALTPLVALFNDAVASVREAAVIAAGKLDSASTVAALIRVLQQDDAPAVRRAAAWALGEHEAREAASALATALEKDADARVREMSAWALGRSESRSGTPALVSALRGDADDKVRESAAWAIAEIEDRTAVPALSAAAESDQSARVRGTAAWAIGKLHGDGEKVPAGLYKVLRDDSEDARLKAAWALGQIGDASALGPVKDALKVEKSAQVRKALVRAMIKSGGRSEESLTELLTSTDPGVREAAVRGLAGHNSYNPWPWPWPRPRPNP
jgi:HEAT repeat protein